LTDLGIGGHERQLEFLGGGNQETICGIAVQVRQRNHAQTDGGSQGEFAEFVLIACSGEPHLRGELQFQSAAAMLPRDLPSGNGGHMRILPGGGNGPG
jgi:hypothetical protein